MDADTDNKKISNKAAAAAAKIKTKKNENNFKILNKHK